MDKKVSLKLLDDAAVVYGNKSRVLGHLFEGKGVIVSKKGGGYDYAIKNKAFVDKFKKRLEEAKEERQKGLSGMIDENLKKQGIFRSTIELEASVRKNSVEKIEERINSNIKVIIGKEKMIMSESALREIRGAPFANETKVDTLNHLDTNAEHWRKLAEETKELGIPECVEEASLYETVAKVSNLRADMIRIARGQRPESEEVQNIVEEEIRTNLLSKFERFNKWAKKNLLTPGVAISVAGIIVSIYTLTESGIKEGAKAVAKLATATANLSKKVALALSPALGALTAILPVESSALSFVAKNLWILVLALAYFLYNEIRKKYKKH